MKTVQKQITNSVSHPLEDFLNIEENSTINTLTERETELSDNKDYDNKDTEIEETYQEIYDMAMTGYERLQEEMDTIDAKYLPRMGEVSTSFLNTALQAAALKGKLKEHKDKLKKSVSKNVTNNNTLVLSREELLENLRTKQFSDNSIIDVEHKKIENSGNNNE